MTGRERILMTLRREQPDRVPMYFEMTPSFKKLFAEKIGESGSEYQKYYNLDMITLEPDSFFKPDSDYRQFFSKDDLARINIDEWGIGFVKGPKFDYVSMIHPLSNANSVDEIKNYPFPKTAETDDQDFISYKDKISIAHKTGKAVMSRGQAVGGTVFWPAYKLRGMEQLFIDMFENREMLAVLLDKVTEILSNTCVKKVRAGIDVLLLADDFGTQLDMMMSLEHWEYWFKERLRKVIKEAKDENPEVIIAFHSDGAVEQLIPNFIDIGVDVLNPIQPECMDPVEIKKKFGRNLSLWGTVGTQTTMPYGTPDDVEKCVRNMIKGCGENGGLIIGPTHVLEPDVPWENFITFIKSVEKYGKY